GFTAIDVSGFDTSLVTSMNAMFKTCSALKSIDLTCFDTANVTDMSEMFYMPGTSALTKIYVSDKFEVTSVSESTGMFNSCTKLSGDKGTEFTAEATDKSYARLDGGSAAPGYFSVPPTPLTLEAAQAGVVVTFDNKASGPVTYRVNGGTEQTIASASAGTITLAAVGDKVQFFGDNESYGVYADTSSSRISCSADCYVYGNIMSLVDSDGFASADTLQEDYTFAHLFKNNSKIKNKTGYALLLPATTLKQRCYYYMFSGCAGLTVASELPATTLANFCYFSMFSDCTNLTTVPRLPAITLQESCYSGMFKNCKNLTAAPELPATTMAEYCYHEMFYNCIKITTAPNLPATVMDNFCYEEMFYGCASLTTAPALPATQLKSDCYHSMFQECTSLTTAPELPATNMDLSCYASMFSGCANLTTAPALPATTLDNYCYSSMFSGCTSLTAAPELPATTLDNDCYSSMFRGCTSLTTAPELPATTLAPYCYDSMFSDCTSLTTAPELKATVLAGYCYKQMFKGCTSLNSVTCLATDISATGCTTNWLDGVAATGTFTKAPGVAWPTGANGIPAGWTVQGGGAVTTATPLTIEAAVAGATVTFKNKASGTVTFKQDGASQTIPVGGTVSIILASAGSKVEFFGDNTTYGPSDNEADCSNISCSADCYVYGNVMSLVNSSGYASADTLSETYTFAYLFCRNDKIKNKTGYDLLLPATTLTSSCYKYMFYDCKGLTTAPVLPAPTLVENCYYSMFYYCSSLKSVTCLATNISASNCTNNWLNNVSTGGTLYKAAGVTWPNGSSGVPGSWSVEEYVAP
ncbi:MAG: leucine-rich repeat protein, partial [Treponema sp.]|nr:leucine-rich repeat protein [Treponema sp.]